MKTLAPGSTIGIVGTGQLGRMLAAAAARLGFRVRTFGPEADPPAAQLANHHHAADYADADALKAFAAAVDVATFEFENIPPQTVRQLMGLGVTVRPDDQVLAVCQDRLPEKKFLRSHGLPTAPFAGVDTLSDLQRAVGDIGPVGILKTRRLGYDGKGQVRIDEQSNLDAALAELNAPAIYEGLVDFEGEVSLVASRDAEGNFAFYDMPRNRHEGGILRTSTVPSGLPADEKAARDAVRQLMGALDYVGVMTVEFFLSRTGELIANEIAPRVHNSGHWTHEACVVSQFEQHIRAVAGWPLGSTARHADAVMTNLIGEDAAAWDELASSDGLAVTLYGKNEIRPGRKMGHTVRLAALGSS